MHDVLLSGCLDWVLQAAHCQQHASFLSQWWASCMLCMRCRTALRCSQHTPLVFAGCIFGTHCDSIGTHAGTPQQGLHGACAWTVQPPLTLHPCSARGLDT